MIAYAVNANQLVEQHLPLVRHIAMSLVRGRSQQGFPLDEACAAGNEGLWRAAQRYRPSFGSFEAFASSCISNAIIDAARRTFRRRRGETELSGHRGWAESGSVRPNDHVASDAEHAVAPEPEFSADQLLDLGGALATLSASERRLVTLRFGLDGAEPLSLVELAQRVGVCKSVACSRVQRALKKLKRAMS